MELKDLQLQLYEKLKPSGWGNKLKGFLLSQEFTNILNELYLQSQAGHKFTPILKEVFRAFEECPYDKLKIVIISQDPYSEAGIADGISFSCAHKQQEHISLRYIFDEIERTVYPRGRDENDEAFLRENWDCDLKRWSNQGILMLNTALTCEINNTGSHIDLWKPFTYYLLDILNSYNSGLLYVFIGKNIFDWHKNINKNNYKFFVSHPTAAIYKKESIWDSGDLFNQINRVIKKQYNEQIIW